MDISRIGGETRKIEMTGSRHLQIAEH